MLQTLGKFEIINMLGQGAMGEVFLARDPVINRNVAIKTLHPALALTPEARDRFFREAQAAGRLSHPNLVTIHDFGEEHGRLFLVMEYVAGQDLAAALAERSLSPRVVLELLAQVCDGLAVAHRAGILHRDIKPSNIRLAAEPGQLRAKLLDFGIAWLQGSELTATNTLLGTMGYMAPEYIQTGRPDFRSDLYSVGVILYQALAGRRPFEAETTTSLLYQTVHEAPRTLPASLMRDISPATADLLACAMAKDPEQRFPSAQSMAVALRAARDPAWRGPILPPDATAVAIPCPGTATASLPPPVPTPVRRSWIPMLGATLGLVVLAGVGWSLRERHGRPGSGAGPEPALDRVMPNPPATKAPPEPDRGPLPVQDQAGPNVPAAPPPGASPQSVADRPSDPRLRREEAFSPWLPGARFGPDMKRLWDLGMMPVKVEGRLVNGVHEFHAILRPFPAGGWSFFWYYDQRGLDYDRVRLAMVGKGIQEIHHQVFTAEDGEPRYQSCWFYSAQGDTVL